MAQFRMKIAGKTAAVESLYDSTRDYCARYFSEEAADFSVVVTWEDLAFEQQELLREALEEGIRVRRFPDPFLDRAAIQRKFAEYLFEYDTLLVHGSTVAVDGKAYLFTAKCGTGKSTHTRLWREVFGDRTVMVNDDKPFLRLTEAGVLACGAPWSGKHGLDSNITVPLQGICILHRGPEDRIWPHDKEEALEMLRKQTYHPVDPETNPRFLALTQALADKVPLWRMECTRDPQAARTAYAVMVQG